MTHPAAHPEIEVVFGPGPPGRGGGQSGSPDAIIVAELYGGTAFRLDVFIHISAVERAGLSTLAEGQNVTFDIVVNRGKEAAENLKVAR